MSSPLVLYDLAPSPNSIKVRVALNYKKIPFELVPVHPEDRTELVRVSGQPLAPVLRHGDVVLFDSAAILRYLDANFRKTPALFSSDYAELKQIERWESIGRRELTEPVGTVFNQCVSGRTDAAGLERASRQLNERTAEIEDALSRGQWLVADRMTAADVTIAPAVYYGMLPGSLEGPLYAFFREGLRLGTGRDRTRAWVQRVMAYEH